MTPATLMTDAELARLGTRDDAGYGALATERGPLPLIAMTVDARVVGLIATVEVAQTFANTCGEPIEATYVFPLPDRAAVTRFRMEVAGRVIEGVIDERGAARAAYDAAIATGHRAAITEEDRAGVFTMRVGNLMPSEVATVRLSMTGPLPVEDGEVTFRFPLVVAPRYIPGGALGGPPAGLGTADDTDAVPDASRITPPVLLPGVPNPVRLAIKLAIDPAGVPVSDVRASLHAASVHERGGAHVVELGGPGGADGGGAAGGAASDRRLDRDFVVRWTVGDTAIRTSLVWDQDAEGPGATFLLTLVPPRHAGAARPRDVVFVLDRSGSMAGWKMVCARRAVARMVDTLGAADRFAVLAFDNVIEEPPQLGGTLREATDRNRFRAVEFLAHVDARGGTELAAPLGRGADLLTGGYDDRDRVLVLVTDGQVGNEDQILAELAPRLRATRVFTLGIDQAVNAAFLRRLAAAGGGACELCESEDRLDVVMDKVHRRIGTPVVTELALDASGLDLERDTIAPGRLPALFAGAPIVIGGRLARAPSRGATMTLRGRTPAGGAWKEPVVAAPEPIRGASIAQAWARARIRDLEDRFAIASGGGGGGGQDALEREIVATSTRFRVLSRFTAFLAVDRSEIVNAGGGQKQVVQPVEAPAGWKEAARPRTQSGNLIGALAMSPPSAQAAAPMGAGGAPPFAAPPAGYGAPPTSFAGPPAPQAAGRFKATSVAPAQAVRGSAPTMPPAPMKSPMKSMMVNLGSDGAPARALSDAPYRGRAGAIAVALETARAASDGRALELAMGRLIELLDDVESIGGFDALEAALREVVDAFREALPRGELAAAAVDGAAALRAIAGNAAQPAIGEAAPPPDPGTTERARPFWKFWK